MRVKVAEITAEKGIYSVRMIAFYILISMYLLAVHIMLNLNALIHLIVNIY